MSAPDAHVPMGATPGSRLRRIVDALQRSLFDEVPAPPATTAPPTRRAVVAAGSAPITFDLRRSRRRSIGFVVGAEGLVVSAPRWVSLREIDAAVVEKARWIAARLAEQREQAARAAAARIEWRSGVAIPFLGESLRIVMADGEHGLASAPACSTASAVREAVVVDGVLRLSVPDDESALRDAACRWLQVQALAHFESRCPHFESRLGVRVTSLALSSAKTRWGSAGANGAVRLNWRLIHFAPATIDYVIVHELAHLREMNHGERFWRIVESVVPDHRAARAELRSMVAQWD